MTGMTGCERVGLKVFTTAIISVAAVMVHSVPLPPFLQALAIPDQNFGWPVCGWVSTAYIVFIQYLVVHSCHFSTIETQAGLSTYSFVVHEDSTRFTTLKVLGRACDAFRVCRARVATCGAEQ